MATDSCVRNGQLREFITAGTSREELTSRLRSVLTGKSSSTAQQTINPEPATPPTGNAPSPEPVAPTSSERSVASRSDAPTSSENQTPSNSNKPAQNAHRIAERRRIEEAKAERERVRNQIKADRIERQGKDQGQARERTKSTKESHGPEAAPQKQKKADSPVCAIQVRTLDGSTVRSTFPRDGSIRKNVRPWLDQALGDANNNPYTLKQIMAPAPPRSISISEEEETLQQLGLTPTATLIMVPVQNFTEAYTSSAAGLASRALGFGYDVATTGITSTFRAVGSIFGLGQGDSAAAPAVSGDVPNAQGGRSLGTDNGNTGRSGLNIRTLHDHSPDTDRRRLYNGNQVKTSGSEIE